VRVQETAAGRLEKTGRVDAVDCARGLALIGMIVYHLSWDLADFRLIPAMFPFSPPMRLFAHTVASVFLALVGVSLALAHRDRLNAPAFWRRLAIVVAAAALVTVGSFILDSGETIWFGILHCIAAASLVALPFIEASWWATLVGAAAAVGLPFLVHSTFFDPPALLWLGLGEALPNTLDWYPLLPWAGVVLIGLGLARAPGILARLTSPWRWRAQSALTRGICFAGRHSLAVYLLHQFILFPLVWTVAASGLVNAAAPPKPDYGAFMTTCERACVTRGWSAEVCQGNCRCVADAIERSGDANRLGELDPQRRAELQRMADACMGRPQ